MRGIVGVRRARLRAVHGWGRDRSKRNCSGALRVCARRALDAQRRRRSGRSTLSKLGAAPRLYTPFQVTAKSEAGRLTNRSASDDLSGYAFTKAYGFSIELDTDAGKIRSGRCLSSTLVDGGDCVLAQPGGLGSGDGVAIGRDATLTVDWPAQTTLGRRLAAGDYSDTITISIAARS